MRIVIIGGVAAGPKAAAKIMRLNPEAQVTVLEKGDVVSYAGCGLPYYVSGVVREQKELMATPVGVVRDSAFFQKVKNVTVKIRTEALEIDRAGKRVKIRDLSAGEEAWLPYDKCVIATGATPIVPRIPGVELDGVHTLHSVRDAEAIKALVAKRKAQNAMIIGGGLIGVEAAEALRETDCAVTIIEMLPQILNLLDWEMAHLVAEHMKSKGVTVLTGIAAREILDCPEVPRRAAAVQTDRGTFPADLVLLAVGVRPNIALAKAAGLALGQRTGAIVVDEHQRTSDPDIYAAGDCVECKHLITGQSCFIPLGSNANKQGRVAAMNVCGIKERFPGVVGSAVCKVFDFCAGRTGLTEAEARAAGYRVVTALVPGPDRAHYMPTNKALFMKLVADRATGRLLGLQVAGPGEGAKRIDVAAMALTAGMTIDALANADLCYAPPYSPAMDNIITAANVARNKRSGAMDGISPLELKARLDAGEEIVLLDVRSPQEFAEVRLPQSVNIPLGMLRSRVDEIPKDKPVVTFCKVSLRGYEGALILKAAGHRNVQVLDGGIAMWPYEKVS